MRIKIIYVCKAFRTILARVNTFVITLVIKKETNKTLTN